MDSSRDVVPGQLGKGSRSAPSDEVMTFETVGNPPTWKLTRAFLGELKKEFPSLDVEAECKRASDWVKAYPARREQSKDMLRLLRGWLNTRKHILGLRVAFDTRNGTPKSGKDVGKSVRRLVDSIVATDSTVDELHRALDGATKSLAEMKFPYDNVKERVAAGKRGIVLLDADGQVMEDGATSALRAAISEYRRTSEHLRRAIRDRFPFRRNSGTQQHASIDIEIEAVRNLMGGRMTDGEIAMVLGIDRGQVIRRGRAQLPGGPEMKKACRFLRRFLHRGARPQTEVLRGAAGQGVSRTTLDRAKKILGIKPKKKGHQWVWKLPDLSKGAIEPSGGSR